MVEYTIYLGEYAKTLTVLLLDDIGGYDRLDAEPEENVSDRFARGF